MWNAPSAPSLLIVEGENGDVFFVESMESSQVEKILKTSDKTSRRPKANRSAGILKFEHTTDSSETSLLASKAEINEECLEYLDEGNPIWIQEPESMVEEHLDHDEDLITPGNNTTDGSVGVGLQFVPDAILDHISYLQPPTFFLQKQSVKTDVIAKKKPVIKPKILFDNIKKWKLRHLTGKLACKYCDTIFKSKNERNEHDCPYLQCDPKNFVCRICSKELSRKTFSNHLHETLDCQYCCRKFVNPRNLISHVAKMHKNEDELPLKKINREEYIKQKELEETDMVFLNEETGVMLDLTESKKKYQRKIGKFECDKCGRSFSTKNSLSSHLDLHAGNYRYLCPNCGEKFNTSTGISKHNCFNKKRRRPKEDFRTFDVRVCRFCGIRFQNFEEKRCHDCAFQFKSDPKLFKCRFCSLEMSKNSYNKHMSKHSDLKWNCQICNKQLSDERAYKLHYTIHSGNRPYKCTYPNCNENFINKQLLIRHTRFHGAVIDVIKCPECQKEVASKYHLKKHVLTHQESAICQLCKMEFASRHFLKSHYESSHDPYFCAICNKSFILPRYLKMHEKLHFPSNSEAKLECCYCNRPFSKRAMKNHVFKNHNELFQEWKDKS